MDAIGEEDGGHPRPNIGPQLQVRGEALGDHAPVTVGGDDDSLRLAAGDQLTPHCRRVLLWTLTAKDCMAGLLILESTRINVDVGSHWSLGQKLCLCEGRA